MFVSNARTEFYDVVANSNKVLLLVGCDVDALCACKILQFLFHCDNVLYTLVPVGGRVALKAAFDRHREQAGAVVLVNCGAGIDLVEFLEPPDDLVLFVADSHRPVDVYNVYSRDQVRLLMTEEDCEGVPSYADLFRDDDEEEDEDPSKRRERRLWEENRSRLLFEYCQTSYFGEPSALVLFNLAWKMSRDNRDLLWWAVVGLTEQWVLRKTEEERYTVGAASLQGHVMRHGRDAPAGIVFDKELNLPLYRHWSLYESMLHSQHVASAFRLWSLKGVKRMLEFLADIGLPLRQCKQRFASMDMAYRKGAVGWMEDAAEKYGLQRIVCGAFVQQKGYNRRFSASDVVLAAHALLEAPEGSAEDRFLDALDALKGDGLQKGIELAKVRLTAITRQVQMFLDMKQIVNSGPFLYAIVQDGRHFCRPESLLLLANAALAAHGTRSRRPLPLLLFAPDGPQRLLVAGVPPLAEASRRNFFGQAFAQAATQARIAAEQDLFCEQFVTIDRNDQAKFLNALFLLLN